MKRVLSLSLVFAASVARAALADDTWVLDDSGAKASHDCAKQPKVAIHGSHDQITLTGACTSVSVQGSGVTLAIESVDVLRLDGVADVADVGAVGRITLTGAQHKVTWKTARTGRRPRVADLGANDTVAQTPAASP
ncbi:MAG TPA: DUF3060 domain-containing protein [Kofleriaceae bacterium]|jgi:hypothetical protein|nr:DUF3060 domain-containing protein [Kofleriaceae bacterium]